MKELKLKVCGLTDLAQVQDLIKLNIDYLGFIFYKPSPRYALNKLTLKEISKIKHPNKVGVFVDETVEDILDVVKKAGLHFIQLHGDENMEFITELKSKLPADVEIIKVFRIPIQSKDIQLLQIKVNIYSKIADYLLFDTDSKTFGGAGVNFNWALLEDLVINKPYFLSGGISEENRRAISKINNKPFALDINSKFELEPGIKDIKKIDNFRTALQE